MAHRVRREQSRYQVAPLCRAADKRWRMRNLGRSAIEAVVAELSRASGAGTSFLEFGNENRFPPLWEGSPFAVLQYKCSVLRLYFRAVETLEIVPILQLAIEQRAKLELKRKTKSERLTRVC